MSAVASSAVLGVSGVIVGGATGVIINGFFTEDRNTQKGLLLEVVFQAAATAIAATVSVPILARLGQDPNSYLLYTGALVLSQPTLWANVRRLMPLFANLATGTQTRGDAVVSGVAL